MRLFLLCLTILVAGSEANFLRNLLNGNRGNAGAGASGGFGALLGGGGGGSCSQDDAKDMMQCMMTTKGKLMDEDEDVRAALEARRAEIPEVISQCFTGGRSRCQDPIPIVEEFMGCMKPKMEDLIKPKMRNCLSNKLGSDFELPEGFSGGKGGKRGLAAAFVKIGLGGMGPGQEDTRSQSAIVQDLVKNRLASNDKLRAFCRGSTRDRRRIRSCLISGIKDVLDENPIPADFKTKAKCAVKKCFNSDCIFKMMNMRNSLCSCKNTVFTAKTRRDLEKKAKECQKEVGLSRPIISRKEREAMKEKMDKFCSGNMRNSLGGRDSQCPDS